MTWDNIPTTVFTPLEYGCIGYSEEDAINKYGEKGIVLYGKDIRPLEWEFLGRPKDLKCYIKLICENTNEKKVIGLH